MSWSEDSIHSWLSKRPRAQNLSGSQGHDAAVLKPIAGRPVLCVDACVEGVHFEVSVSAIAAGRKAAGRVLSDLAATGAIPEALLLALRAPADADESRLLSMIRGVGDMGLVHGAPLVGGDTTCAPGPLSLSVTAMGRFLGKGKPPGRDRARAGQVLVVTGALGGSLLGRHLKIEPRFGASRWLLGLGATALMDVSDGLLLDLERLAAASGVAVDLHHIPIHAHAKRLARQTGQPAWQHALTDGEDYELLACLPKGAVQRMLKEAPSQCPGLTILGEVRRGKGVHWDQCDLPGMPGPDERPTWLAHKGWLHGTR